MKYQIDQIALFVEDAEEHKKKLGKMFGADEWVEDKVQSDIILFNEDGNEELKCENVVKLKFNYELMKTGIEFELLEMDKGYSYHQHKQTPGISHFGCHVDGFEEAVEYFENLGCKKVQYARTRIHTGTDRKYQYIFMDTRHILGYYLKLINRVV